MEVVGAGVGIADVKNEHVGRRGRDGNLLCQGRCCSDEHRHRLDSHLLERLIGQRKIFDLFAVDGDELTRSEVSDRDFFAVELSYYAAVHRLIELNTDVLAAYLGCGLSR